MSTKKQSNNDCFALPPGVDWTPLDNALLHLKNSIIPTVETEALPINLAIGRILDSDLEAVSASPPFSNSAVDGFAFKFVAGHEKNLELKKGR